MPSRGKLHYGDCVDGSWHENKGVRKPIDVFKAISNEYGRTSSVGLPLDVEANSHVPFVHCSFPQISQELRKEGRRRICIVDEYNTSRGRYITPVERWEMWPELDRVWCLCKGCESLHRYDGWLWLAVRVCFDETFICG